MTNAIPVKRKDLEAWREFVEECGVPMVKWRMTMYLKKEDGK